MNHIYLSHNAGVILLSYFRKAGHELMLVPPGGRTYSAVDAHPDIYYCRMEQSPHPFLFRGDPLEIGRSYPDNIRFNAVALDRYFIHRLKNTSPALLKKAREMGLECINVNQGYTKCNCVVVDGHSLITSDEGIDRTLQGYPDLHVLKIRPANAWDTADVQILQWLSGKAPVPQVVAHEIWNGQGNPVYPPAREKLAEHGLSCKGKRAQLLKESDYDEFDYIIGMDDLNLRWMKRILGREDKISLLMDYTDRPRNVADPWYTRNFDVTYDDIVEGCEGFLSYLIKQKLV